jgi:hypothetical protein
VYTQTTTVTLTSSTPGAVIYYTTDGTSPTTSSKRYNSAVPISATSIFQAISVADGFSNSAVSTAVYTIQPFPGNGPNYRTGFTGAGITLNGNATYASNLLRLTDGRNYEAGGAFFSTPVNAEAFTTDFTFRLVNATADGFTFCLQNDPRGVYALGSTGGELGYGQAARASIKQSVAIKFDLDNNAGEGYNSTGLYTDGQHPTYPAIPLGSAINLHSGRMYNVHMQYAQSTLLLLILDAADSTKAFARTFSVDIPSIVGGSTALAGFTGATGGLTAVQDILSWNYVSDQVPAPFSAFGAALTVETQPPYGFRALAQFTLGAGRPTLNPVADAILITANSVGLIIIPPGTLTANADGSFSFSGSLSGLPVQVRIAPVSGQPGSYVAMLGIKDIDLTQQGNPVTLGLRIGGDAGRKLVTWAPAP